MKVKELMALLAEIDPEEELYISNGFFEPLITFGYQHIPAIENIYGFKRYLCLSGEGFTIVA